MPFKSEKQRRWMWANEPEMAKEWSMKQSPDKNSAYAKAIREGSQQPKTKKKTGTTGAAGGAGG
jgi:hypothetical protein